MQKTDVVREMPVYDIDMIRCFLEQLDHELNDIIWQSTPEGKRHPEQLEMMVDVVWRRNLLDVYRVDAGGDSDETCELGDMAVERGRAMFARKALRGLALLGDAITESLGTPEEPNHNGRTVDLSPRSAIARFTGGRDRDDD